MTDSHYSGIIICLYWGRPHNSVPGDIAQNLCSYLFWRILIFTSFFIWLCSYSNHFHSFIRENLQCHAIYLTSEWFLCWEQTLSFGSNDLGSQIRKNKYWRMYWLRPNVNPRKISAFTDSLFWGASGHFPSLGTIDNFETHDVGGTIIKTTSFLVRPEI